MTRHGLTGVNELALRPFGGVPEPVAVGLAAAAGVADVVVHDYVYSRRGEDIDNLKGGDRCQMSDRKSESEPTGVGISRR